MHCRLIGAVALASILVAGPAVAHLALVSPPSRYGGEVLKYAPCGQLGGARGAAVAVFEPGAAIEVVWDEYIDHPGHFRIAFDADGDDGFVDPTCVSGCGSTSPTFALDPDAGVLLDGIADTPVGGRGGATVVLPDVECERCTLQVIQVMYDKPPFTIPGNDIYYQCADLALRRSIAADCAGDCDGDGRVTVDEVTLAVRMALGLDPIAVCPVGDRSGDGRVSIDEVVGAVAAALGACGAPPE